MSTDPPRTLLVDDERSVQTLLTYPLRKDGYEVVTASTGQEALERFRDGSFDLVVLDVMLPQTDGFAVCRELRARSSVPIIMLTAKTEEFDKVLGLELGADDYITKPFSMREFRSRVKAVLRRAGLARNGDSAEEPLDEGDLRIDFAKRSVELRDDPVKLTYVEFEILSALARSPGRVFSRSMLLERLWGDSAYRDPRTIDVHIRHLREKLEAVIGRDITGPQLDELVRAMADAANARVTLLGVQESSARSRAQFYVISDSNAERSVQPDTVLAARALALKRPGDAVARRRHQTGEVAKPLFYRGRPAWIAIYSRPFSDVDEVVSLVRNRLLEASAAALLVALISGFVVARVLTRSVTRLERAARDLAAGRPVQPLPVESADELGRLTQAFNEMQIQLARVDRARKEFIANASHELRTPIFSLAGLVELLQNERLDPEPAQGFPHTAPQA